MAKCHRSVTYLSVIFCMYYVTPVFPVYIEKHYSIEHPGKKMSTSALDKRCGTSSGHDDDDDDSSDDEFVPAYSDSKRGSRLTSLRRRMAMTLRPSNRKSYSEIFENSKHVSWLTDEFPKPGYPTLDPSYSRDEAHDGYRLPSSKRKLRSHKDVSDNWNKRRKLAYNLRSLKKQLKRRNVEEVDDDEEEEQIHILSDDDSEQSNQSERSIVTIQNHNYSLLSAAKKKDSLNDSVISILPISPVLQDNKIKFSSIGGLEPHIRCLKEMIMMPMMYPEVFSQFQIHPPKGVLFHGPPGTGKTLIARALVNECNTGKKKVTFFERKGADLLSKWVGESEKQLTMLFKQASEMKPSIIFFDELDGLAPVRSFRADSHHFTIVSTLLALMDGLENRGDIIIIGATNRVDAIDSALRRPGRFDRELVFSLPSRTQREEILKVHVSKWKSAPSDEMISYLARHSVGYSGADLRALCAEAVINSFRRTYPQVYESDHRVTLNPETVTVEKIDFLQAKSILVPAAHRQMQGVAKRLMSVLKPLLSKPIRHCLELIENSFPHGTNPALASVRQTKNMRLAQLLITGEGSDHGQTNHLVPALLHEMEHIKSYILDCSILYEDSRRSPEEVCIHIFNDARRNAPAIIYIPKINKWWELVPDTVKCLIQSQLTNMETSVPIFFLATADCPYKQLSQDVQGIFSIYRKEVFELEPPNIKEKVEFFKQVVMDEAKRPPHIIQSSNASLPHRQGASTSRSETHTEGQVDNMFESEEEAIRELRIRLRSVCKKLMSNNHFYMFTKQAEAADGNMTLNIIMHKIDYHLYQCSKEFLDDTDKLVQHALNCNNVCDTDKLIKQRAAELRAYAYSLIKSEISEELEERCREVARLRKERSRLKVVPNCSCHLNKNENEKCERRKLRYNRLLCKPPQNEAVSERSSSGRSQTCTTKMTPCLFKNDTRAVSLDSSDCVEESVDVENLEQAPEEVIDVGEPEKTVECSEELLQDLLNEIIASTEDYPLMALLDLFNHLRRIVKKYSSSYARNDLPAEMGDELRRFKREFKVTNQ